MASISLFTIFLIESSMSQVTFADNNFLTGMKRENIFVCFLFTWFLECQLIGYWIFSFPGSNDIVAVIGEDGDFRASPFSVQFGKMKR